MHFEDSVHDRDLSVSHLAGGTGRGGGRGRGEVEVEGEGEGEGEWRKQRGDGGFFSLIRRREDQHHGHVMKEYAFCCEAP